MNARAELTFAPRLLGVSEAAAYLGVSATTLTSLPIPRRVLGRRRLFDRLDLDRYASDLPYEGAEPEINTCEGKFGRGRCA